MDFKVDSNVRVKICTCERWHMIVLRGGWLFISYTLMKCAPFEYQSK